MVGREKYELTKVFTPAAPARVTFVDRDKVNNKLVDALTTPGMQLVVYGHSGTGKTTLLVNKLQQLYSFHVTTRCMKGTKFEDLILDAFSQLECFYTSEKISSTNRTVGVNFAINSYEAIKSEINSSVTSGVVDKSVRYVPPQLTPQTLGKLLGEAGACWVLEDFHKISSEEKVSLSQMMKVFMDMSDDYPSLKIVAIGAVETGRQVVDYDGEMKNRISEICVELMTDAEISSIIKKGQDALNIKIPDSLRDIIIMYANGLPATCHHLCLKMCRAANINETSLASFNITKEHCDQGLREYVDECSDSIKSVFDNALKERRRTKYQQPALVLYALTYFNVSGASRFDILNRIRLTNSDFPDKSLKTLLDKLISSDYGSVLRYDGNSALYSFSDPVYKAYAMARLKHEKNIGTVGRKIDVNTIEILNKLEELIRHLKKSNNGISK